MASWRTSKRRTTELGKRSLLLCLSLLGASTGGCSSGSSGKPPVVRPPRVPTQPAVLPLAAAVQEVAPAQLLPVEVAPAAAALVVGAAQVA